MASGSDIAKAYVQIIPSAEGIKGQLEDILGDEVGNAGQAAGGKFSKIFGGVAKAGLAALGAAAAGISALVKGAVSSYADYEQLVGGSKLLYGDAYDFIAEKAANAWETVQMSQNDYLEQVNGFATGLKTALGGNAQAAAELADRIVTAEADVVAATGNSQEAVQNAFNGIMKSNFTMLDNLQLGITPTKEGFQEVIDKVNEWNAANGNATEYVIDNLADCQSALVDYIEMQGLAGYAASEGADTISGSIASTQAAWQNLLTAFADPDANLGKAVSDLVTSASNALENLVPVIMQALGGIGDVIGQIAPLIAAELPNLLHTLVPSLNNAALKLVLALADGIVQNLPMLIGTSIQMITTIITGLAQALPQLIGYLPDLVLAISTTILDNLPLIIDAGIQLTIAVLNGIIEALPKLVRYIPQIIISLFKALINGIAQMQSAGRQLLSAVVNGVRGAISSVVSIGKNIVQGIWQGISSSLGWIKDRITGWVGNVVSFLKNLFKIGSPSKLMRDEVGIYLAEGIGVGFEDGMTDVEQAMQNSMPDLQSMIQPVDVPVDFTTSGAALRGYAAVQTQNTPDPALMDELRSIRRDLTNLRVYLDTGVLVGAVNSGLGSEYLATKRRALA
jgi:phage-related protein